MYSHEQVAKYWSGLGNLLLLPENADLAGLLTSCKKALRFKLTTPEILLSPTADVSPPPEKIKFPKSNYTEHLQICNGMMDVPSRKREVVVVAKEYGAVKKARTGEASAQGDEEEEDDWEEDDWEEDEFPEVEEMDTESHESLTTQFTHLGAI